VTNTWLEFCELLVAPSPKVQDHEVGFPLDVSVNWTASPGFGDEGNHVKFAPGMVAAVAGIAVAELLGGPWPTPLTALTM
jgi:hypothetical protein